MWKVLVYGGVSVDKFSINEDGIIKNNHSNTEYKEYIGKSGYPVVSLPMGNRGKVKVIRVHKAVAETFIPNPEDKSQVHHRDENKLNHSISNLEWVTPKENIGYHHYELSKDTEFYNNRKLSQQDVLKIKELKGKISFNKLSKMFNVSKTTISNVMNNVYYA